MVGLEGLLYLPETGSLLAAALRLEPVGNLLCNSARRNVLAISWLGLANESGL